jgi:hypothetical protein
MKKILNIIITNTLVVFLIFGISLITKSNFSEHLYYCGIPWDFFYQLGIEGVSKSFIRSLNLELFIYDFVISSVIVLGFQLGLKWWCSKK